MLHVELLPFQEVTVLSIMPVGKKYWPLITKTLLSGRTLEARADGAKIVKSGLRINFFASLQGNYDVLLYCMLPNCLSISLNSSKYILFIS